MADHSIPPPPMAPVSFDTHPSRYKHWKLRVEGEQARLTMPGQLHGGLREGYELGLACDEIVLVDDGSSSVSLPEVPLLAVLPGTGGLTRLVDKRKVRRDLADVFCTTSEGIRGKRAVEWRLVDAIAPRSKFD